MPSYTVVLTDEQQLALEYETERRASQPMAVMPGSEPPPPPSPQDVIQQTVTQHLDMLGMQVKTVIDPLQEMLIKAAPDARTGLIDGLERPSLKNYLRALMRKL